MLIYRVLVLLVSFQYRDVKSTLYLNGGGNIHDSYNHWLFHIEIIIGV